MLNEVDRVSADGAKRLHQRYLDIYKIIERRVKEIANTLDNLRRSTALMQIVAISGRGLLSEDELNSFSHQLENAVKSLINGVTPD